MADPADSHQGSDDDEVVPAVPTKKPRLSFTETIDVLVGPDKKCFVLHKNPICSRSKYFSAACSERWASLEVSREFLLPEDNPDIFNIYLNCIYRGQVDVGDLDEVLDGEEDVAQQDLVDVRLVNSYILVDRLLDVAASNMFMDALIDHYLDNDWTPSAAPSAIVSHNTRHDSPLRQMFVDTLARSATSQTIQKICNYEEVSRAFVGEILVKKTRLEEANSSAPICDVFDVDFLQAQVRCKYFQHDDLHPQCGDACIEDTKKTEHKRKMAEGEL